MDKETNTEGKSRRTKKEAEMEERKIIENKRRKKYKGLVSYV
jgi:hypothetical protein